MRVRPRLLHYRPLRDSGQHEHRNIETGFSCIEDASQIYFWVALVAHVISLFYGFNLVCVYHCGHASVYYGVYSCHYMSCAISETH